VVSITISVAGLYALHRIGLWMEDRGLIYYLRRKPSGSSLGSFVALQKVIEPRAEHVLRAPRAYHRIEQEAGQETDPASPEGGETEGCDDGRP
jgi:hypothetical protein